MSYRQFAGCYDRLMADMPYSEWIQFANDCWSKYRIGSPWEHNLSSIPYSVVDLGCGTGSIAIPLAQTGIQVIGVDLSADMLTIAQEKTSTETVVWIQQDMRTLELTEQVDCVLSFCDCFNYLTEEEDIVRTFRQVNNVLSKGGLFLFDVHTPQLLQSYYEEQPFLLNEEDIAYIWTCDFDPERTEITNEITFFVKEDDSASERFHKFSETHVQRAYQLDWLKKALDLTGFVLLDCVADFTWDKADISTERAFFIARKK